MFRSSEFGRLGGVAKGDVGVIGRGESNKNFIRRGKGSGIRGLDETSEGNGGIIGPEGRNSFVVLRPFCEVDSRSV